MLILQNATIFDGENEDLIENANVVIEGERIREIKSGPISVSNADVIDLKNKFLMPGLIDLHFHAYSATFDMQALDRMPKPLLVSYAAKHLRDALQRGFTTVRDPGGGDIGLSMAIEQKLIDGPRFLYGGKALSQTGGHGDMRPAEHDDICNCAYSGVICQVVDGEDQVRKVAREELRKGADHIKVFISGGVTSPTDPMWMPQFTDRELQAAVDEATTRRKYVIAHCHTDDGARRCVVNGIRSIEHATQISDQTAQLIAGSGTTYIVPTLAVAQQLMTYGTATGMPQSSLDKVAGTLDQMLASIQACRRAGVKIGLGTDLFGTDFHYMQSFEFEYRSAVDKPVDILRSATSINAEIVQRKGDIGIIAEGAFADIIVLDSDPLQDLSVLKTPAKSMPFIMKNGTIFKNEL